MDFIQKTPYWFCLIWKASATRTFYSFWIFNRTGDTKVHPKFTRMLLRLCWSRWIRKNPEITMCDFSLFLLLKVSQGKNYRIYGADEINYELQFNLLKCSLVCICTYKNICLCIWPSQLSNIETLNSRKKSFSDKTLNLALVQGVQ